MVASRAVAGARARRARGGRGTRAAHARVGGRARTARRSRSPPLGPTRRRQRADDRANRGVRGRPGRDRDRAGEPRAPVGVAARVGGAPRRWRDAGSRRHVAGRRRAGRRVPSRPRRGRAPRVGCCRRPAAHHPRRARRDVGRRGGGRRARHAEPAGVRGGHVGGATPARRGAERDRRTAPSLGSRTLPPLPSRGLALPPDRDQRCRATRTRSLDRRSALPDRQPGRSRGDVPHHRARLQRRTGPHRGHERAAFTVASIRPAGSGSRARPLVGARSGSGASDP